MNAKQQEFIQKQFCQRAKSYDHHRSETETDRTNKKVSVECEGYSKPMNDDCKLKENYMFALELTPSKCLYTGHKSGHKS